MPRPTILIALLALLALLLTAPWAAAEEPAVVEPVAAPTWTVDTDASLFAVVTHKEGLAAGLAHEHFVVATTYDADLVFDRDDEGAASFRFEVETKNLVVDDAELAAAWQDELLERELIAEAFAELSDKDRGKIRDSMLGAEQLDAGNHPAITARLHGLWPVGSAYGAQLELTVRGRTVSRSLRFEVFEEGAELTAEASCSFLFSDFGIKPYSAMLGTIKVADSFDLFVRVVARR